MPDPSRLVTVPSLDEPGLAPDGCSTFYVLEPVPNLNGTVDWRTEAGPMRDRLHGFLAAHGYPSEVLTEQLVTPLDWQDQGMAAGTPFALAHTFAQTGPFRPGNVERRLPGMFFAGSGTVPGVGVPMVLISGQAGGRARCGLPAEAVLVTRNSLLTRGYRECARLTWRHGTTYFWGAALLPRRQRKHVYAVYALCRLADDIVDVPSTTSRPSTSSGLDAETAP